MTHPPLFSRSSQSIAITAILLTSLSMLASCSDKSSDGGVAAPEFEADTSYLDGLAQEQGIETQDVENETTQDTTQVIEPINTSEPEKLYTDEEREWTEEGGSKSLLGRSRDRAKDLRDQIQGSTEPDEGLAITQFDEEYAQAAGFAWDMPEDWRMAVPGGGRFAEMYIQNPLGNASVVFTKETISIPQIKRSLQSTITDTFTSRTTVKTSTKVVLGHTLTIFDLEGTYLDPSAKRTSNGNPFYAIHAVVIELPTTRVLIKLWGPQDTVNQNKGKFDAMIEKMYER